jgi:hypothetical protein
MAVVLSADRLWPDAVTARCCLPPRPRPRLSLGDHLLASVGAHGSGGGPVPAPVPQPHRGRSRLQPVVAALRVHEERVGQQAGPVVPPRCTPLGEGCAAEETPGESTPIRPAPPGAWDHVWAPPVQVGVPGRASEIVGEAGRACRVWHTRQHLELWTHTRSRSQPASQPASQRPPPPQTATQTAAQPASRPGAASGLR